MIMERIIKAYKNKSIGLNLKLIKAYKNKSIDLNLYIFNLQFINKSKFNFYSVHMNIK